jgi:hypothetical protein
MIVCPTTDNDWDNDWDNNWDRQDTFECYDAMAFTNCGVRGILDCVTAIFGGTSTNDQQFCFSYAEVGCLRQYLEDPSVDPPSKMWIETRVASMSSKR